MLKSYVGLASPSGLELLLPESRLVVQTLTELAGPRGAVCCWAVLPDTDAAEIESRLAAGEGADALALLEAAAQSVGRLLPDDSGSALC